MRALASSGPALALIVALMIGSAIELRAAAAAQQHRMAHCPSV